ncbi:hypothetical protein [Caproiciproducens sp. LBM24188]
MEDEFIVVLSMLALTIFFLRWIYWSVIDFQLNKKTRKERKKGQTFKEWLLYSRYRKEIPKPLLYLYFGVWISHSIFLAFIPICYYFMNSYYHFVISATEVIIMGDVSILGILNFAFRGRKDGRTYVNVGRWFKKGKH